MAAVERQSGDARLAEAMALRMAQADGKAWRRYLRAITRTKPTGGK